MCPLGGGFLRGRAARATPGWPSAGKLGGFRPASPRLLPAAPGGGVYMTEPVRVPRAHSPLMTPAEAAAVLHVDANTLARWSTAGKVTAVRTPGGHRRYLTDQVIELARSSAGRAEDRAKAESRTCGGPEAARRCTRRGCVASDLLGSDVACPVLTCEARGPCPFVNRAPRACDCVSTPAPMRDPRCAVVGLLLRGWRQQGVGQFLPMARATPCPRLAFQSGGGIRMSPG